MSSVPNVARAFFPLDEELGLLPHQQLTPLLQESVVRVGARLPFAEAVDEVHFFRHTQVSRSTVRRLTQAAGASQVALQEAALATATTPVAGPTLQLVTLDGAFVPLVGGEWKEVKTLTLGEVGAPVLEAGRWVVHSSHLSYFSRLAEADTFQRLAEVETRRRGLATAHTVGAPTDGARWIQRVLDEWRPDAVRILDFPHATEYLMQAAQAVYGAESLAASVWFHRQRRALHDGDPQQVIAALHQLSLMAYDLDLSEAQQDVVATSWSYLRTRLAMIQYATFQALGYPIGSGAGESANKLVVEKRLKGAGMRWAEGNVNAMLALCNVRANGRWREAWPQLRAYQLQQVRQQRRQPRAAPATPPDGEARPTPSPAPDPKPPYRPAANHPWRRYPSARPHSVS